MGETGKNNSSRMRMLAVAIAAEMVYQLTGSNMSSPQTAELNAKARAPTIGKWVNINNAEAGMWITFLCWLDNSLWPAVGGLLALVGMIFKYKWAIKWGMDCDAPGTEDYGLATKTREVKSWRKTT